MTSQMQEDYSTQIAVEELVEELGKLALIAARIETPVDGILQLKATPVVKK